MSDLIPQAADDEAWLYDSKDDSADTNLPPGTAEDEDTGANSQETNGDDSQEESLTLLEEPVAEKASESAADDENDGEVEEGEEEDDDDEDDIEITIGDTKAVPAAAASTFPAAPVNINIKKSIATTAVSSSAPGGQLIKAPHKGLDIDAVASINGTNIYEFNIDSLEEKPWRKPGADITDYFNYGFTEDTWKVYCDRQRRLRGDNNSSQGVKSLINQVASSAPQYEKPYRPSFQSRSDPKEFRKSGTIDVIGGANSRRHEEALPPMMPPLNDMPFPPGLPPGFDPHGGMPPPPPHHGMPPPHAIPPPPPQFDPRFPPPTMDMAPPFDPYGGPPPHAVVSGDFHRPDDRPPMMPDDMDYSDRRRHHRSRDDREERDYRDDRDRRHRSDRGERDDRRDRDREDRDSRRDRDKDRDRDRDHRDMGDSRHRSSRKSRRHDDEEEDRRQKHKRSKRDDDN